MVISYIGIAMRSCLQMPDDVAMLPGDAVAEVFHVLRDHTGSAGGREGELISGNGPSCQAQVAPVNWFGSTVNKRGTICGPEGVWNRNAATV